MRLPNGYGSVYKLSGKRRNPWVARKTTGFTLDEENQKSYPIYKFVGYYPTKKEALEGLAKYNNDPFDLENYTLEELYNRWSEKHFEKVSHSNINGVKASWKLCEPIKHMNIQDIKLAHIQKICDDSGKNSPTLKKFKVMFGLMYDYAVINEMLKQDKREMIRYLDINKNGNPNGFDRTPFTDEEINLLWKNKNNEYVKVALILIYTGARIGEILDLRKENVHIDKKYLYIEKAKTNSGIREIPIAEKIVPFIEYWYKKDCDYLICSPRNRHFEYSNFYRLYWKSTMQGLNMNHKPHDARHTCISKLANKGVDERIIKSIVGHAGSSVTESVYTHIKLDKKLEAINLI